MLADPEEGEPEVILIATGSEVALAVEAHEQLISDGVRSRVVSLPCWELFDRQDQTLPRRGAAARCHRAGLRSRRPLPSDGIDSSVPEGAMIGMHTFGSSAPLKDVQTKFGFTPDKIAETAKEVLGR